MAPPPLCMRTTTEISMAPPSACWRMILGRVYEYESCHTCVWPETTAWKCLSTLAVFESRRTNRWVVSMGISYVTHSYNLKTTAWICLSTLRCVLRFFFLESRHTNGWVMSMGHITQIAESCPWVTSHRRMSLVTHVAALSVLVCCILRLNSCTFALRFKAQQMMHFLSWCLLWLL